LDARRVQPAPTAVPLAVAFHHTLILRITHDYPLTALKAFSSLADPSKPFRFIYVSGEGADQSEKGRALFSRIKGRTEKALNEAGMSLNGLDTISVRPGGIIPTSEVSIETFS
jgi:hypothetical protein